MIRGEEEIQPAPPQPPGEAESNGDEDEESSSDAEEDSESADDEEDRVERA